MIKVYVVVRSGGEYSDWHYEIVKIYADRVSADDYVAIKKDDFERISSARNAVEKAEAKWEQANPGPDRSKMYSWTDELRKFKDNLTTKRLKRQKQLYALIADYHAEERYLASFAFG